MHIFSSNNNGNDTGLQTTNDVLQMINEIESSNLQQSAKDVLLRNLHRFLAELKEKKRKELEKRDSRAFEDSFLHYRNSANKTPIVLMFRFDSNEIRREKQCPQCGAAKLYQRQNLSYKVFDSSPSFERYNVQCETRGCTKCGTIFHAQVPLFLSPEAIVGRLTARTVASIALRRYVWGIPNLRQERISEIEGEIISRTTQHDALAEGRERLRPLFEHLCQESANAVSRKIDDRAFPILDEQADIEEEIANARASGKDKADVRHGIHSTVVISTTSSCKQIILMETSRSHQGNVEWELNQKRTVAEPMITTSDLSASAKNIEPFPEKNSKGYVPVSRGRKKSHSDMQNTHRAGCWAHLRLHIVEAKDAIPDGQDKLLNLIASIFKKDAATTGLSAGERLAFHQEYTMSIVDEFFESVKEMMLDLRAEPNSSWGNALEYSWTNMHHFRLFLEQENVSLHTNQVEGTHTMQWRHENNSQHYKTALGAQIGDVFQSLALTAMVNQENPLHWIGACLEHCEAMAHSPSSWMPWNFRDALAEVEKLHSQKKRYRIAGKRQKKISPCLNESCASRSQFLL